MAVIINESFKSMCLQNLITKLQEDDNYNLDIDKLKRSRTFKRMLKLYIKMCSQSLHTYDSRNEVEEIMQQCYNNLILLEYEVPLQYKHRNKLRKFLL